jgi:hypothetical protein
MTAGAPEPSFSQVGHTLWLAYFTTRDDHCAVIRFDGVSSVSFGDPNDEALDTHPLYAAGLQFYAFHEVQDPELAATGKRRWIATFHDDTLDITARRAEVVVRAIEARSADAALGMVRTA